MAVFSTTEVFTDNEQVTPQKLNNIAILSKFIADAISDGTLKLNEAGQLSVGIVSGENIASNAITDSKIAEYSISQNKLDFATVPVGFAIFSIFYSDTLVDGKYLLADGRYLNRNDYSVLFSRIGTFYGYGDSTNFRIPDMRGMTAKGYGTNVFGRGDKSLGVNEPQELLSHTHTQVGGGNPTSSGIVYNGGSYRGEAMITSTSSITGSTGGSQNRVDSFIGAWYIRVI